MNTTNDIYITAVLEFIIAIVMGVNPGGTGGHVSPTQKLSVSGVFQPLFDDFGPMPPPTHSKKFYACSQAVTVKYTTLFIIDRHLYITLAQRYS